VSSLSDQRRGGKGKGHAPDRFVCDSPQRGPIDIRSPRPADPATGLGRYLASVVQDVCTQGDGV